MAWYKAADLDELEGKKVIGVTVETHEIAIYRLDDGYFATSNICTHQFAFMSEGYVENDCVECPLHQAFFDIRTGKVMDGPATEPLKTFAIKVEDTAIWVEIA